MNTEFSKSENFLQMRVKIIILLLVVNVVCESYNQVNCWESGSFAETMVKLDD